MYNAVYTGKLADLVTTGTVDEELAAAQRELQEKVQSCCIEGIEALS